METFIKISCMLVWTALCIAIAVIPETAMYFMYSVISPQSDLTRILTLGFFWIGGAGFCIFFAVLGIALWASMIKAFSEMN